MTGHVIIIWAHGTWHIFMMDAVSRGHMIAICALPRRLLTTEVSGGIDLTAV